MNNIFLNLIEKIDNRIVKSKDYFHIPNTANKLLYIDLKPYNKKDLTLPSGDIIKRGSLIGEIHVDNQKIKHMNLGFREILLVLKNELDSLSLSLTNDPRLYQVSAFYGRTILYSLLKREGFTILNIERGIKVRLVEFWTKILRLVYSNNTIRKSDRTIKAFWITRDQLLQRKML